MYSCTAHFSLIAYPTNVSSPSITKLQCLPPKFSESTILLSLVLTLSFHTYAQIVPTMCSGTKLDQLWISSLAVPICQGSQPYTVCYPVSENCVIIYLASFTFIKSIGLISVLVTLLWPVMKSHVLLPLNKYIFA